MKLFLPSIRYGPVFCVENQGGGTHKEGKFASWELKVMKQEMAPHK